jgi:hypothetical protein
VPTCSLIFTHVGIYQEGKDYHQENFFFFFGDGEGGEGQEFWHFFYLKNTISTRAKDFCVENAPTSPDFQIF